MPIGADPRFADLRQRTLSGVALGVGGLGLLWLGGIWSALLVTLLAGVMAWEWRSMVLPKGDAAPARILPLVVTVGGCIAIAAVLGPGAGVLWLLAGLGAGAGADLTAGRRQAALWSALGGLYIGVACLAFLALRFFEPFGFLAVLWIILVVAASDIGGYFAGRLVGGPKLWPAVSPKKTWAGLAGGVALAFILGGLFSAATTGTYFYEVCTVSSIAALLAQAGDLAESAAKRHFGVKDTSALLPGHGGALDRFDGLMAATLVATAVTYWRGQTVFIW